MIKKINKMNLNSEYKLKIDKLKFYKFSKLFEIYY